MNRERFHKIFVMGQEKLEEERKAATDRMAEKWNAEDSQYILDIDTYQEAFFKLRKERCAEARADARPAPVLRLVQ